MYKDFAHLYDRVYSDKDYAAEVEELAEVLKSENPEAKTLLDVACGTASHLVRLQDHFQCEGLDLNKEMIEIARKKLPGLTFHVCSMTDFSLGREFSAVVCLFSAVGHLKTVDRLNAAVVRMAEHLSPGGVLAIEPWIDPADWLVGHVGLDTYEDEDMKVARMTLAEPVERGRVVMEFLVGTKAGVTRIRDEHEMGWFTRPEYESAFRTAGLSVRFEKTEKIGRGLYVGTKRG